jgi:Na+/melibiose symporter-like transporter
MLAIALGSQRVLRRRAKRPKSERPAFDYLGALLFSTFLVALLLTLTLGPSLGWLAPTTITGVLAAALLLAAFVVAERRTAAPMLDLALFRQAEFALAALAALVVFLGISATRFLVPFFLQSVQGYNPATVGLLIVPAAVITAIAAPFAGRFADRWGVRLLANIGMGITTLGFGVFTVLHATTPAWVVVVGLMVMSLGMAVFGAANSAAILNSAAADAEGATAGFVNLCRNSGNVIGVAFGTVLVTLTMGAAGYPPSLVAVNPEADPGILSAFAGGIAITATMLTALATAVLAFVVGWSWRAHTRRQSAP